MKISSSRFDFSGRKKHWKNLRYPSFFMTIMVWEHCNKIMKNKMMHPFVNKTKYIVLAIHLFRETEKSKKSYDFFSFEWFHFNKSETGKNHKL